MVAFVPCSDGLLPLGQDPGHRPLTPLDSACIVLCNSLKQYYTILITLGESMKMGLLTRPFTGLSEWCTTQGSGSYGRSVSVSYSESPCGSPGGSVRGSAGGSACGGSSGIKEREESLELLCPLAFLHITHNLILTDHFCTHIPQQYLRLQATICSLRDVTVIISPQEKQDSLGGSMVN